jgi:DNA mismatch repair protein MutL
MSAYQQMLPADSFPMYVLFLDLDPAQIDVNVHPTKQEIKFEDEKLIYAFVQAAVKHSLAQFSITPTLEFDLDANIQQMEAVSKPFTEENQAAAVSSSLFKSFTQKNQAHFIESDKSELKHWKDFYENAQMESPVHSPAEGPGQETFQSLLSGSYKTPVGKVAENTVLTQLLNTYIIAPSGAGYLLIHQQAAHERILYERYETAIHGRAVATQRSLFPATLQLSPQDALLLQELMTDLNHLGYLVEPFGNNSFVIQGTPADLDQGNENMAIENLLEQYKHFSSDVKFSRREKLIRSVAAQNAVKPGKTLGQKEMKLLVEELFECNVPNITAAGHPTYIEFKKDYLEKLFRV